MNTGSLSVLLSARVYTIVFASIVALATGVPVRAQSQVTYEPMLTKGPATAPVTIVEFSDYQ
ncbi:MAG TPA: hypothetical protein VHZ49_04780 [Methylomirabilota bacterium]|nr:hypothetical protein [Methylomirabilota bacterium]